MIFEQLKEKIEHLKSIELLGVQAHRKLAPFSRPTFTEYQIPKDARKAGVMVLLYPKENNKTHILLTKRANYKGTHGNQISFPGGKYDINDSSLRQTSLRETNEEVGINDTDITIVKSLTPIYIPPSNFKVSPYLGMINDIPNFVNNYEVAEIIDLPAEHLLQDRSITTFTKNTAGGSQQNIPCFAFNDHKIWGATAMILNEVKEVLKNI
ncbi:NUDIX hydrolase [Wenyingzhuangia sp. IMCC45533]